MATKLIDIVAKASGDEYRKKNDDDFSDRLSSKYTVGLLVIFAIVVGMTQYVGKPIVCWTPAHFTKGWARYTDSYCWVKNTYFLPWENVIPLQEEGDEYKQHVTYYQWIPFILLAQALLFYFPTVVWHAFNSRGGVDADSILETAHTLSVTQKADNREKTIDVICKAMDTFLCTRRTQKKCTCDPKSILSATLCRPCGKRFGCYLTLLFILSKLCYLGNAIGQFFLLDKLLGFRYALYGIELMENGIEASQNWDENSVVVFPRITMCDFEIRRLGNLNRYTMQCVLPINLYNEKIFLFLWFWMVMVAVVSFVNLIVWIVRFIFHSDRLKFIKNHLIQFRVLKTERDVQMLHRFLDDYLKQDGAFLLRLIAHNTNNITVTEITYGLWNMWNERMKRRLEFEGSRGNLSDTSDTKRPLTESTDTDDFPDDSRIQPDAPLHDVSGETL